MGKRNERLAPEVIKSQPSGVASLRFKLQRVLSGADEDTLESADQIALALVLMRFNNKVPAPPTQPEKAPALDCTHVTDDEDEAEEDDDAHETPTPLLTCITGKRIGPLVAMALPRPPPLPRPQPPSLSPPLPLEQRQQLRFPHLPEGRPLPPAPTLPSLRMWSTVPPPAASRSKE